MVEMMYKRVGDPRTEEEMLRERSPLFKVDSVKIPMLIAQGANDPRVVQAESDQFVEAMRENGLEVDYIVFEDEGHGFAKPENRLRFYGDAEVFLARHMGGRSETEPAE
jgi:dipeptidyl aminopeptidase/acylaminoacyl peptidase